MQRKLLSALLAVMIILSSALFSSCGGESDYPVSFDEITIQQEPERIVVLSKNLADIISTMGYDVKMVGRSDEVTQKGLQVVPSVGSAQSPSAASIDEVKAEVVFSDAQGLDPSAEKAIKAKKIPIIKLDTAATPKQVRGIYKRTARILEGNVTGKKAGAESYDKLSETLKSVRDAAVSESDIIKTIAYLYMEDGVLKTFNQNTWGSTMLGLTGATNVFKSADTDVVDIKALALSNPDFIFCADKETQAYLSSQKDLKKLSALKTSFILPYDEITMQGNTALSVLEDMLKKMYPEEFSS